MKKIISVILTVFIFTALLVGCTSEKKETTPETSTAATEETGAKVIRPLPETLNINKLDNCTVAVSFEKGDVYVDDSGKMMMDLTVYSYELYDMVDIATLSEEDIIVRQNKEVKVTALERLDTGLVHINGGEEEGGFDLYSNDSTVYYEMGMNDAKAYYELGKVSLPVSDEFEYVDESELDSDPKVYYPGDFLTDNEEIRYDFNPRSTSVVIENGVVIRMNKHYIP